jgi:hypothetical protein
MGAGPRVVFSAHLPANDGWVNSNSNYNDDDNNDNE